MMFTERSKSILDEVKGLTPRQSKMYITAWKHNKECFGYMGLCELWQLEISSNIRLKDVEIVIDRLGDYGFFHTDAYYKFASSDYPINDFIPCIYEKTGVEEMIFRIMARNKERTEAYAELLDRIELMADGRVFCVSQDGSCSFSDRNSIMYNASIKRRINHYMFKIGLDGYGISEVKRAGRGEKK